MNVLENSKKISTKKKVSLFIKSIIKTKEDIKKDYTQVYYKEDRLENIKSKLNEIEESVLNYNQHKSYVGENQLSINIKELEKVYCDIIE
ncbi:hypothetical protein [Romboutsia lituseburensis]|uniref:hypothetical protein n=1 Tax=Romboutsia lituseburensis TaxID=1537 RepID=UPI00215A4626|nr:hypothetical protein [Romboutsia lituseburensis]MCR8746616.1 hypothetical protein [Romboutsia lituseburensis]